MKKEKVITIKIPESSMKSGQYYTLCPWCGHKTKCSDTQRLACPACGQSAFSLPCGAQIE